MDSSQINAGSYATFGDFDSYSYNCIKYLMDNDELVWKLLKYNTNDAWNKPNLTQEQKAALIYDGSDNTADFRVFLDSGQPDVITDEITILRISPFNVFPANRTVGIVSILFECYAHYKVNHLSNYKTRVAMIMQRYLQVFNGAMIGGIGRMYFDRVATDYTNNTRMEKGGQTPTRGMWLVMSNKSN